MDSVLKKRVSQMIFNVLSIRFYTFLCIGNNIDIKIGEESLSPGRYWEILVRLYCIRSKKVGINDLILVYRICLSRLK